ncbi:unnamed protein product [Ambrosiozyma monospora]|uniref:Unnamed protein product n=1 Tax=Ambrosiozyma monospora TaxID=43982 RepID=A0ACB5SVZ4_AMBMO|nr:unnamed protein product [Ambrosiozyma monospora]
MIEHSISPLIFKIACDPSEVVFVSENLNVFKKLKTVINKTNGKTIGYHLPKSLNYFECDPANLCCFNASSLDDLMDLPLKLSEPISENDPCWEKFPANIEHLNLVGNIPKSKFDAYQNINNDYRPYKLGGLTIPERVKSSFYLMTDELYVIDDETDDEADEISFLDIRYFCINDDESDGYDWKSVCFDERSTMYFNIVLNST